MSNFSPANFCLEKKLLSWQLVTCLIERPASAAASQQWCVVTWARAGSCLCDVSVLDTWPWVLLLCQCWPRGINMCFCRSVLSSSQCHALAPGTHHPYFLCQGNLYSLFMFFFVIFSITYISLFFAPVSQNFVHLLAWFYHLLSARLDYDMAAIESLTQLSMIWLKIPFSQEMSASLANPQFPAEAPVTYDGADAGGARSNEMSGVTRAISPPFITQLSRAGDCWRCHQYFVVIFRILYTILAPSPCWKCLLVCSQSIT